MNKRPVIVWFRRDLRLGDNPALAQAIETGAPIIPLFILSDDFENLGAASRWRLEQSLNALSHDLKAIGSRLTLRRGEPVDVFDELLKEVNPSEVFWARQYSAHAIVRDSEIKAQLRLQRVKAQSVSSFLLFEPWTVATAQGTPFKVYSPFWRAVRNRNVSPPIARPAVLSAPINWPICESLGDWGLSRDMQRGARVLVRHCDPGEAAALARLDKFVADHLNHYAAARDFLGIDGTSRMAEYLTFGEISAATLWHRGLGAMARGEQGAEQFLKEICWREFAWHLLYFNPEMSHKNWRVQWDAFPWRDDNEDAEAWRRGMTGEPIVDAAMRELYATGRMHNRARMIVASYLTKHLLTHWRVGQAWFAECLTDHDEASNAMGWQWVAGCGPDAAPFFRIFNPERQRAKFDPDDAYVDHWLGTHRDNQSSGARDFLDAAPVSWTNIGDPGPQSPIINLAVGRARALEALGKLKA